MAKNEITSPSASTNTKEPIRLFFHAIDTSAFISQNNRTVHKTDISINVGFNVLVFWTGDSQDIVNIDRDFAISNSSANLETILDPDSPVNTEMSTADSEFFLAKLISTSPSGDVASISYNIQVVLPNDQKGVVNHLVPAGSARRATSFGGLSDLGPGSRDILEIPFDTVRPRITFEGIGKVLNSSFILKYQFNYEVLNFAKGRLIFEWKDEQGRTIEEDEEGAGTITDFIFDSILFADGSLVGSSGSMKINFPTNRSGSITIKMIVPVLRWFNNVTDTEDLNISGPPGKPEITIEYDNTSSETRTSSDINLFILNPTTPLIQPGKEQIEIRPFYKEDKYGRLLEEIDGNNRLVYSALGEERISDDAGDGITVLRTPAKRRIKYTIGDYTYDNFPDSETFLQFYEAKTTGIINSIPESLPGANSDRSPRENNYWRPVDRATDYKGNFIIIEFKWFYDPDDINFDHVINFLYKDVQIRQYGIIDNKPILAKDIKSADKIKPMFRVRNGKFIRHTDPVHTGWKVRENPNASAVLPAVFDNDGNPVLNDDGVFVEYPEPSRGQYQIAFELPIFTEGFLEVRVGSQNGFLPVEISAIGFGEQIVDADGNPELDDEGNPKINDPLTSTPNNEITYSIFPDTVKDQDIRPTLVGGNDFVFDRDGPRASRDGRDEQPNNAPEHTVTSGPIYFTTISGRGANIPNPDIPIDDMFFVCPRHNDHNEILDNQFEDDKSSIVSDYHLNEFSFDMYPQQGEDEAEIGGGFISINEMITKGNNIFFVVQVKRSQEGAKPILSERHKTFAMLCYIDKTDVDLVTPDHLKRSTINKMKVIKKYNFSDYAPRSFSFHEGYIHFYEGSQYGYNDVGVSDFLGIKDITYFNDYQPGNIYRIVDDDANNIYIEYVSGGWQSDVTVTDKLRNEYQGEQLYLSHAGTVSPLVSTSPDKVHPESELNLIIGAGDLSKMIKYQITLPPNEPDPPGILEVVWGHVTDFIFGSSADNTPEIEKEIKITDHNTLIAPYESDTLESVDDPDDENAKEPAISVLEAHALNADINNWHWLRISRKLEQRLSILHTNKQKPFDLIKEIAYLTHSIIGYDTSVRKVSSTSSSEGFVNEVVAEFFVKPRDPYVAKLKDDIDEHSEVISYTADNRDFTPLHPADGSYRTILIGEELIAYTALAPHPIKTFSEAQESTPVLRGYKQTIATSHKADDKLIYINHVLDLEESAHEPPINDLNYRDDSSQLYNQVEITYRSDGVKDDFTHRDEDPDSIKIHGELETQFTVPLDRHQLPWIEYIAEQFLERNKDMHYLFTLVLKPTFYLKLGDIVLIRQRWRDRTKDGWHIFLACQVYDISHSFQDKTTTCIFRTI